MREWWELMEKRATRDDVPIKPQRVAWELSELVSDDAIISTDSGTITTWIARQFRIRGRQKFNCSGTLSCKVLCHNLCCLIQSMYELGLKPKFWKEAA
jgi:pyruvate dehydrogenase (quinone)